FSFYSSGILLSDLDWGWIADYRFRALRTLRRRGALLLRPGRNHAVAARVRDRLPQMLVLIFEDVHQRVLLRPVSSEQFHRRLQVVIGNCRNRFLQIEVRSLQSF